MYSLVRSDIPSIDAYHRRSRGLRSVFYGRRPFWPTYHYLLNANQMQTESKSVFDLTFKSMIIVSDLQNANETRIWNWNEWRLEWSSANTAIKRRLYTGVILAVSAPTLASLAQHWRCTAQALHRQCTQRTVEQTVTEQSQNSHNTVLSVLSVGPQQHI